MVSTDFTIGPPPSPLPRKPAMFVNEKSMAARHEERCYEKNVKRKFHGCWTRGRMLCEKVPICFIACKGLSNDDVKVVAKGAPYFRRRYDTAGSGFSIQNPAILFTKSWGGGGYGRMTFFNVLSCALSGMHSGLPLLSNTTLR